MSELYVLYEHAAGYGLFCVKEFEEVGMLLPQVEQSVTELKRFNQIVSLVSFHAFKSAFVALENINSVSEGLLTENLQLFLEQNVPKKKKTQLGVADPKLAATISETLGISCVTTGVVPEVLRGIRYHFSNLVKGFSKEASSVAQLGLGHSYSRAKVKFNIHKNDNMIIQSICLLDQLDKDINIFAMRIREWYSYHFPELAKLVPEMYLYAKCVKFIKNRKELDDSKVDQLEEIVMDRSKAEAIYDASKSSMGMDISPVDLLNIELFASRVIGLSEYRTKLSNYLHTKMEGIAPNLATLIGDQVGARLISHAGSLTNLAKFPASTVQILGAEKALFRALKARSTKTPKYGLLYHSSFISKAELKNKGRISRFLANKCTIASRIDCFSDVSTSIYGEKLKAQVEDRLKFYITGEKPEKNVDVMKEAAKEIEAVIAIKKEKKKAKKRKHKENGVNENSMNLSQIENTEEVAEGETTKKKKKKKKNKEKDLEENGEQE
ncbi:nucleolar protein 56 [Cimex lectularius]|uniref:Nucleolar protein 56 n=1 Tax=Cimex lectularius TaxID=79782 RepID=A0A8I6RSL7_CIMLE|nr:nucleolar protein 56 [Cimex lectularius]